MFRLLALLIGGILLGISAAFLMIFYSKSIDHKQWLNGLWNTVKTVFNKKVKNISIVIMSIIPVLLLLLFLSLNDFYCSKEKVKSTNTTYSVGEVKKEYHPGIPDTSFKMIKDVVKSKVISKTSSFKKEVTKDNYNLKIEAVTFPKDSIYLNYELDILLPEILRVDTLNSFQVDTVKYETVIEEEVPFYKNFWFGALVATLVFSLIKAIL